MWQSRRLWMGVLGLSCLGSVGIALWAQHHWAMEPCPWCILQRMLFVVVGVLAVTMVWSIKTAPKIGGSKTVEG